MIFGLTMAQTSLRPCAHPGCPNLVREGRYCSEHQHKEHERRREVQEAYDHQQRDAKTTEFYASSAWRAVRRMALRRDKWLCQDCLKRGRVQPADTVHHVVEVKDDWSRRLELGNLVSLCAGCHNARHKRGRGASNP